MKKIALVIIFCSINAVHAMENPDTPFPEEGFVDPDDAVWVPGKPIWNFYDGSRIKHMLNPNLDNLINKYLVAIIRKKCGSSAALFFQNNPDDARSTIMSHYGKAVCWQIQKYHNDTTDIPSATLEKAERQVPFTLSELIYIEQNVVCYFNEHDDPAVKQALKDLKGKSRSENRTYLNNLLKTIKASTEEKPT